MVATSLGGTLLAEVHGVTLTPVAAQFTSANSERLSSADNAALSFGANVDMTIAGWVYFDTLVDFEGIFGKDSAGGATMEYRLIIGAPGNPVFQVSPDGTAGAAVSAGWTQALVINTWYFIVCTYNQAQITIRVNQGAPIVTAYTGDIFNGTDAFALGSDGAGAFFFLNGRLDAWGVWKRVLTEAELSFLYNGGHARRYSDISAMTTSLVAWWQLDETSGNRADSHGANTLTDNNTVTSATGVDISSFIGLLPIDRADDTDGINEIGSASLVARATPTTEAVARVGREIRLSAEGEGEIWRGFINGRDRGVTDSEMRSMSLQCLTLDGRELGRRNTWRGVEVIGATVQETFDAILSGTGWSTLVTGAGYATDITKRWDNTPRYGAAQEARKIVQAYTRRTTTQRQLEVKNAFTDSGIILKNVAHLGPEIGPDNPTYGAVAGVRKLKEDGNRIVNRIAPFGKTDGDTYLDLRNSDRVTPYAIQSFIAKVPTVTNVVRVQTSGSNAEPAQVSIECTGNNRVVLGFVFQRDSTVAIAGWFESPTGSVEGLEVTVSNDKFTAIRKANPRIGAVSLFIKPASASALDFDVVLVAVQDADIIDPVRERDTATATSTDPGVTLTSALGDLVIDGLAYDNTAITPTAEAGQTVLESASATGAYMAVSSKPGAAGTTDMGWTLSGAETWGQIGYSIKPALTFYIEDTDSQDEYGLSEIPLPLGDFTRFTLLSDIDLANTLYDRAVDELLKRKDPSVSYEVDVDWLPDSVAWLPGDTMLLDFYDEESGMQIDEDLIVVKRTRSWGEAGDKRWKLTLSNLADLQDELGDLVKLAERVNQVQSTQV